MLADALCSEYGWPLRFVRDELPLCQAFAMFRAIKVRNDQDEGGPTFEDEEMLDGDMSAVRRAIRSAVDEYRQQQAKKGPRP